MSANKKKMQQLNNTELKELYKCIGFQVKALQDGDFLSMTLREFYKNKGDENGFIIYRKTTEDFLITIKDEISERINNNDWNL